MTIISVISINEIHYFYRGSAKITIIIHKIHRNVKVKKKNTDPLDTDNIIMVI